MNKIKRFFWSLALCLPLALNAQSDTPNSGIKWTEGLSWEFVKAKAKKENKYIFVDCYATWCGPCKKMDAEVYPSGKIGEYLGEKFIAIKVQMDSSKKDNQQIKNWYSDAHNLKLTYSVNAFPTYLFFSPNGEIVHRSFGFKSVKDLLSLLSDALNTEKQYYILIENYKKGLKDFSQMPYLVKTAGAINDNVMAMTIAIDYKNNYLYKLNEKDFLTKENLEFIWPFIETSEEKGFKSIYQNPQKIDEILRRKGSANGKLESIIVKEEIDPKLWKNPQSWWDSPSMSEKPDWKNISTTISKKYSKGFAERTVLDAQIRWYYNYKKDWPNAAKYYIKKNDKYGFDTVGFGALIVNEMVWYIIFEHSTDKATIDKGIKWLETIIKTSMREEKQLGFNDASIIDTYANLLYKAGRVTEAITWENKALQISIKDDDIDRIKQFNGIIEKMKKGVPTWGDSNRE